ncbi:hypothetical protein VTL71DRAFT_14125 [Oculimacula yallundae]|uniref:Uncharacterized protein n=1 Tax=Oculimacula yallundae TaxID=86028 RepID=A0ABR4CHK3_9HELO
MFTSTNIRNPSMVPIGNVTYTLGRKAIPPPCSCTECLGHYRSEQEQRTWIHTYTNVVNSTEADSICRALVVDISQDFEYLQQQMKLRASGISQRWRKKTVKNREALLKAVDPNMYDKKWHEGHIGYESRYGCWLIEARKQQNIHLLPYLSVENLKEDTSRLITLLRLRTTYTPAELAAADNRRLAFGWTTGILETSFNRSAVVMYGSQYGSVVPWVQHEVHRGDSIGFPRGELVLRARRQLLSVLRRVVELLVDGLVEDTKSANPHESSQGIQGIPTVHVDEPFSMTLAFDIQKIEDISLSRQNAATDHLLLLQTDPGYIRRYVELVQISGYSNKLPDKVSIAMMAQDLDFEAWTVRHWVWIRGEVSDLRSMQVQYADQIRNGQYLPEQFSKKLASFETLLLHLLDMQSRHIQCILPYRPGFQRHYNFKHSMHGGVAYTHHSHIDKTDDVIQQSISNAEAFVVDPLHWCIVSLTTDPDSQGVLDKFRLLDFLDQHLSKASAEERGRIDEVLLRKISDLAAFNELLALVRSHRPRAEQTNLEEQRAASNLDAGLAWRMMSKTLAATELNSEGERFNTERSLQEVPLAYAIIGKWLQAFMEQEPLVAKQDSRWMDRDLAQRKALRGLWSNFRREDQTRMKKAGISPRDMADDLKLISYDTDPVFMATLESERKEFLERNSFPRSTPKDTKPRGRTSAKEKKAPENRRIQGIVDPVTAPQSKPLQLRRKVTNAEAQTEWGSTPADTKPVTVTKDKVKTRGTAFEDQDNSTLSSLTDDEAKIPEKVKVKKAAYEVFRSLYAGLANTAPIPWTRFVDAMAKVGFLSSRSGGSAVTFEPCGESRWFGSGSIVIHRPHPDSAIDAIILMEIGKRMKKWFGWDAGLFQLD